MHFSSKHNIGANLGLIVGPMTQTNSLIDPNEAVSLGH